MVLSALPGAAGRAPHPQSADGILTPLGDGALNRQNHGASTLEGRGAKQDAMAHLLKPAFSVKPHPPNLHVPPRLLHPVMLLPRENLPLACLDCAGSDGDFGQARFFEANIRLLELESRLGSIPNLMIARYEPRGTVYALERQKNGLYVMCKMGAWIDLDELADHATAVVRKQLQPAKRAQTGHTIEALTTPQLHHEHKKKRAAIEAFQSLVKKRARSVSTSYGQGVANQDNAAELDAPESQVASPEVKLEEPLVPDSEAKENEAPAIVGSLDEQNPHTADDVFDNIRNHYFDALYKSMGSLAYFAKGPLSRARSAFHLDLDSILDTNDLIEFLKGLILTTVHIDKKYRETVPELLSKLKDYIDTSDEGRKKKRKPKRMKLGKDALYPLEDESIRKWWTTNKSELTEDGAEVSASQMKSHISILRTRETQLQMIIIMEILALESSRVLVDPEDSSLPGLPNATDSQDTSATGQPKKRKKHNLPVLLDVHADRLAIWQSTVTDEQLILEDTQSNRVSVQGAHEKKASSEPLKDFCVDVIVPFFSARLPELCDSINRKLGGPAIIAPVQSKSSKRPSASDQKRGSLAKRPTPQKSRRTLQRALSTDQQSRRSVSRGPSNAIALLRSATSTTISSIKRESIDSPLLRTVQSSEKLNKGGMLARSSSLGNLRDHKAARKSEVEAQLQEAISALRKPNRDVIGQLVDSNERRSSTLAIKKTRKPATNSRGSNVQVKATPANNRFKDVMTQNASTEASQKQMFVESIIDVIPPSSVGPIERSTGHRSGYGDAPRRSPSPEEAVGDTPIKRPDFMRGSATANTRPHLLSPRVFVPGSAVKASHHSRRDSFAEDSVGVTPMKKPTQRLIFGDRSEARAPPPPPSPLRALQENKTTSIYEKLGWDDELDDLA